MCIHKNRRCNHKLHRLISYSLLFVPLVNQVHYLHLLAELGASLTLYTIANGDDNVEVIDSYRLFHTINTQKMRVVLFFQLCI